MCSCESIGLGNEKKTASSTDKQKVIISDEVILWEITVVLRETLKVIINDAETSIDLFIM